MNIPKVATNVCIPDNITFSFLDDKHSMSWDIKDNIQNECDFQNKCDFQINIESCPSDPCTINVTGKGDKSVTKRVDRCFPNDSNSTITVKNRLCPQEVIPQYFIPANVSTG